MNQTRLAAVSGAIIAVIIAAVVSMGEPSSLIVNGGFEDGLAAPWAAGVQVAGSVPWWNSGGCSSTAAAVGNIRHTGRRALHLVNSSGRAPHRFGTTSQRISIVPNRRYRLSLWARGRSLASAGAINFTVDDAWRIRPISLPAGSFEWKRFEAVFSLPVDHATVRIICEDSGEAWLDEISVTPEASEAGAPSAATQSSPPAAAVMVPGRSWDGRTWGRTGRPDLNFQLTDPEITNDNRIRYHYVEWPAGSSTRRVGSVIMDLNVTHGGRFQGVVKLGEEERILQGAFVPDGRLVVAVGRSWPASRSRQQRPFWATIDLAAVTAAPRPLNLNHASVAELITAGLSSGSARSLAEGRIVWGRYGSVDEAIKAPGLSEEEKRNLRENTTVR